MGVEVGQDVAAEEVALLTIGKAFVAHSLWGILVVSHGRHILIILLVLVFVILFIVFVSTFCRGLGSNTLCAGAAAQRQLRVCAALCRTGTATVVAKPPPLYFVQEARVSVQLTQGGCQMRAGCTGPDMALVLTSQAARLLLLP